MFEDAKEWLNQRGGLFEAAKDAGVTPVQRYGKTWVSFPYYLDGKLVNRKYRCISEKRHEMDKDAVLCLWNADVLSAGGEIIITEGEFDALAAMTAGYSRVVSVPNGAGTEKPDADPFTSKGYAFMWRSEEALNNCSSFVLALDDDKVGRNMAHHLASILGPEKCKFVRYPEGCKDLNEVLVSHGAGGVVRCIEEAQPVPVVGLYYLRQFPEQEEMPSMDIGIRGLDEHMRIVLGSFTVFSGYSNMGKSTVLNTILANAMNRGINVCVASFETAPKPILRDELARAMLGCSFEQFPHHPERAQAYMKLERHLTVISNALDDDADIGLEQYLELARIAVVRDGAKIIVLDPWNELEHKRQRDETETDYIGRAIRSLKRFARRYDVALWVVAHPTKPQGKTGAPGLYDIAGSANWSNKADYGLIYHRPDKTVNEGTLNVVKVRMGFPGMCGVVDVCMDKSTSRIAPIEHEVFRA